MTMMQATSYKGSVTIYKVKLKKYQFHMHLIAIVGENDVEN